MRTSISTVVLLCLALPARADWIQVLPGSAERVVAATGHVAVVRGGEVWILRDDGSVVGRVGKRTDDNRPTDRRAVREEAEEILDVLGVSELDRDEDWALDLLDDERTVAQRRSARLIAWPPSDSAEARPALAASSRDVWIAGKRGALRIGPDGAVFREFGQHRLGRVFAGAGRWLAVAMASGLALLSLEDSEQRYIPLPEPAGKVALSPNGDRWAATTHAGIARPGDSGGVETVALASTAVDLAYCGEELIALTGDSLVAIPVGAPPEVRASGLRAHRLLCPPGEKMPWLVVGPSLQISFDRGRRWQTVPAPASRAVADVAATAHHLWLATSDGLYFSSDGPALPPPLVPPATPAVRKGRRGRGPAAWLAWLPKLTVRASAAFAPGNHQFDALALASFPFDARRLPLLAALDQSVVPPAEASHPRHPERTLDAHDPDGECLTRARRKAVELAMAEPERAQSYVARAGRAAWLPELRVLVSRRYGRSESMDVGSSSTALSSPLGIDTVNDIRYEARATWDLAKLVFSAEELAAQNQALHMAELRRDIESSVNRLYFERRRLALDIASADGGGHLLREREIEAELDSLSAGLFGTCVSEPHDRVGSPLALPAADHRGRDWEPSQGSHPRGD